MSDLHSINEAINKKAGRKLLPSIFVSLSIITLVWFSLSYQPQIFVALVAFAVILGGRELGRAFANHGIEISFTGFAITTLCLLASAWNWGASGLALSTSVAFIFLLIGVLLKGPEGFITRATGTTFSLLYLPFLSGFLILLARDDSGFQRVMTLVLLISCNDTFGYIVGTLFGKHALVSRISPKKSWEGLTGSLIFTIAGGVLAFNYILDTKWWFGIFVGLIVVFTATCGDLIESAIKRDMSLKDMGSLLPGHGGMLDRLDSVVLSAPAMWLALEVLKNYL